jgi:hypothetical protein
LNVNPLNAELNPICHLLALLGAPTLHHAGGIRVKKKVNPILRTQVIKVIKYLNK